MLPTAQRFPFAAAFLMCCIGTSSSVAFPVLFSTFSLTFPCHFAPYFLQNHMRILSQRQLFFCPNPVPEKAIVWDIYWDKKPKLCKTTFFVPVFLQTLSQTETNFLSISRYSDRFDCPNFRQKTVPKEFIFPACFGTYTGTKKQANFSCIFVPITVIFLSQSHAVNPHGNKSLSSSQYQ